jgi:hypothetical protein
VPSGRGPVGPSLQQSGAKVQFALVLVQVAVTNVEWFVIDQQTDDLGVGHVDHDLILFGVAVSGLGVGQGTQLVHAVQIGAL